jgi:dipeptidyl aminopeptidase/acylaminoacyl peptidase
MRRAIALLVPLVLASSALPAQGPTAAAASTRSTTVRPFTFDDVLAVRQVSDPQLSPDGSRVVYVVSRADMKENAVDADVWLVSTTGGAPIRLTTAKKSDAQPRWSPDGRTLAFVSARGERPQVFLIDPNGGEADQLTESKGGVSSFQWSPDGRRIAFIAQRDLTSEEERRQKDKDDAFVFDREFRMSRVSVIDVATRAVKEVVRGDFHVTDVQWSPDGAHLAWVTSPTNRQDDGRLSDIWIAHVDSATQPAGAPNAPRLLVRNTGPDNAPRWSPDGRTIAFLTRPSPAGAIGELGLTELAVVSTDGGTPRLLAPDFLYQAGTPAWSADGRTISFTASVRTGAQLFAVDVASGAVRQLSDAAGLMGTASLSRDGRLAAFTASSITAPNDVHVATLADMRAKPVAWRPRRITDHNPQVAGLALGRGEIVKWKSRDGMEIEGLLVYPVDYRPGRKYPTVAFIHGGPSGVWSAGFPAGWGNYAHVWASNGWLSFFPNVRGSSGYGEKFLLSNVRDWGGGDFQDIQSGLDTLVARGLADPERLAQSGWSYGGYMTAWTITQTTRFKAAMVGAGLTNMYSMYSTNDLQRTLDGYFGAEPWDDEEAYRKASAMTFIKRARTPTLIMHGQVDQRVPFGQAQELYQGLSRNDVPVELVVFPREPHGLGEPRHQLDKMKREYAWFARWVLGEKAPSPQPALVP